MDANTPREEFTVNHREQMAERLAEDLHRLVKDIGEGKGRSGVGPRELKFETATDQEMRGYIAGIRDHLTTIQDWIEYQFPCKNGDFIGANDAVKRLGVSYEAIHMEMNGAEGELMQRRHPNAVTDVPGRFRRLTAWLLEIRATRVSINCNLPAGPRETFSERYTDWVDLCDQLADVWVCSPRRAELAMDLSEWKYRAKNPEENEARARVESEFKALERVCFRRRDAKWKRQREETDRQMEKVWGAAA